MIRKCLGSGVTPQLKNPLCFSASPLLCVKFPLYMIYMFYMVKLPTNQLTNQPTKNFFNIFFTYPLRWEGELC